jgi:uncharacterized membrane protein YdbT with pleckstrin-like domain
MAPNDAPLQETPIDARRRGWGYLNRMLLADEYIVHVARLHWAVYVSSFLGTAFGIVLLRFGSVPAEYFFSATVASYVDLPMRILALFCIVVGTMYIFFISIRFVSTELVVTNERFIYKRGLIAPTIVEATITKISSVDIIQTVPGRVLDYGDITVRSSGQDIPPIGDVADPYTLYYYVMRAARLELRPDMEAAAAKPTPTLTEKALTRSASLITRPSKPSIDVSDLADHNGDDEDEDA